ncbi:hypothetical protein [Mesonia sp. HuA40]|uniref:hypothetical protein n=1 Tax=Mesonia sp. HuA40 TaxID=2602761 RepID=UPI0011C70223|nr:hypothetical protein [Mesonia sp. HuA40]TXK71737.1 hypothetical protein FT993_08660 [Mesonia sp. HuA40]
MEINKKLKKLYEKETNRLLKNKSFPDNIDGPNLMYCWEDEYLSSEYKILFIGREPNGWMGDLHLNVDNCIKRYKDFELCENGKYTTFWQYIYETKNLLMPDTIGKKNFLWSNVSKFSKAVEGSAIELEDFKFFCDNFKILEEEIKITKPDVIIFFTGNNWDKKIQYQIKDKIKFTPIDTEIDSSELARLIAKPFPLHTYRVAHPITLQTQGKWNYMEKIISNIKSIKTPVKKELNNIDVNKLKESLSNNLSKVKELKSDLINLQRYKESATVREIEIKIEKSLEEFKNLKSTTHNNVYNK